MKKLLIVFSFALALTSCVREQFPFSGREIGISVGMGRAATKAADTPEETLLTTIPVQMEDGTEILLEAWLSDTDCTDAVATKGAQLNDVVAMASAYGMFKTTVYENGQVYSYVFEGSTTMKGVTVSYTGDSDKAWEFDETYYWPDEYDRPLTFISYAPAENSGIENFMLSDDGKVLFDYSTPVSEDGKAAEAQLDLLVGLDPNQSRTKNHGNAEVNFKHALTSVKFVCDNWSGVQVDSIRLENFYSTGHASYDGNSFEWSNLGDKTNFTQLFGTIPGDEKKDVNGNYLLDDSTDGERTFMVIPQLLSGDAKITVFLDRTHGEVAISINELKDIYDNHGNRLSNWSGYAGKTITFKVNNDKIDDFIIIQPTESGQGYDVKFTGDESNKSYIRAAMVLNLVDSKGNIITTCFNDKEYAENNVLAQYTVSDGWERENDGFYYYSKPLCGKDGFVPFITGFSWTANADGIRANPVRQLVQEDGSNLTLTYDHLEAEIILQSSVSNVWVLE